jgi:surfeit locus 1 family protein
MKSVLKAMFSRRWFAATLLVLAGTAVCIRLGIWQLQRLDARRAFNAHMTEMWSLPELDLNAAPAAGLTDMEYRSVRVAGQYDFTNQVALRNQYHENVLLRLGQAAAELGGVPDPSLSPSETRLDVWNNVNLDRIGLQLPYKLLPVYVQPDSDPADSRPPIPYQPEIELNEGPHLGYAGQWFVFASLLFFGYPFVYLRNQALIQ